MSTEHAILEAARDVRSLEEFRARALVLAREALDADVALFATLEGGRAGWSAIGMDRIAPPLARGWDAFGSEIVPVQAEARRVGVATDRRVLGRELERTRLYREVIAPLDGRESLFVVPEFGGRTLGFLMLGRTGRLGFADADLRRASRLVPSIAVSCAALERPLERPLAPRPAPELSGLTDRERELLAYVELGYTTREIAAAVGTSPFTVRNQLSALYRKLGVSNRAEAAGLRAREL